MTFSSNRLNFFSVGICGGKGKKESRRLGEQEVDKSHRHREKISKLTKGEHSKRQLRNLIGKWRWKANARNVSFVT